MPTPLKYLGNKKLVQNSLLAKWKDGLYYKASVERLDMERKRCLIRFEDSFLLWYTNTDIHLQLPHDYYQDSDNALTLVCSVCELGTSEPPNDIILCDVCQQGYHQACHDPPVPKEAFQELGDEEWCCSTCNFILSQNVTQSSSCSKTQSDAPSSPKKKNSIRKNNDAKTPPKSPKASGRKQTIRQSSKRSAKKPDLNQAADKEKQTKEQKLKQEPIAVTVSKASKDNSEKRPDVSLTTALAADKTIADSSSEVAESVVSGKRKKAPRKITKSYLESFEREQTEEEILVPTKKTRQAEAAVPMKEKKEANEEPGSTVADIAKKMEAEGPTPKTEDFVNFIAAPY